MTGDVQIVLASASPRRHELLGRLGVKFAVLNADIDESLLAGETPVEHVLRLAREKALEGWRRRPLQVPVLGADTVVVLDHDILGKPAGREEAVQMLERLSGRQHEVFSAVAVADDAGRVNSALSRTPVTFMDLDPAWIRRYCAGSEPLDKAGAYAIQGEAGQFVSSVDGSFTGVMGLPLEETRALLEAVGVRTGTPPS